MRGKYRFASTRFFLWGDDLAILAPTELLENIKKKIDKIFIKYNLKTNDKKCDILSLKIFKSNRPDTIQMGEKIALGSRNNLFIINFNELTENKNLGIADHLVKRAGIPIVFDTYKYLGYPPQQ